MAGGGTGHRVSAMRQPNRPKLLWASFHHHFGATLLTILLTPWRHRETPRQDVVAHTGIGLFTRPPRSEHRVFFAGCAISPGM